MANINKTRDMYDASRKVVVYKAVTHVHCSQLFDGVRGMLARYRVMSGRVSHARDAAPLLLFVGPYMRCTPLTV